MNRSSQNTQFGKPIIDIWVNVPKIFPLDEKVELREKYFYGIEAPSLYSRKMEMYFSCVSERFFPQSEYKGNELAHLQILPIFFDHNESGGISFTEIIEMKNKYLDGKNDLCEYAMRTLYNLILETPILALPKIRVFIPTCSQVLENTKHVGIRTHMQEPPGPWGQWKRNWQSIGTKECEVWHTYVVLLSKQIKGVKND